MQCPRKVFLLGIFSVSLAGLAYLASPRFAEAGSYGMGSGMMGPGMMGSPRGSVDVSPSEVNPARTKVLLSYIHEHNAACLQCHVVSGASFGPSFASIAANYANQADQADAEHLLASHIAHGFGRMPPGLASDAQAAKLARLILELPGTESPKHVEKGQP